jgi:hypothetical protein
MNEPTDHNHYVRRVVLPSGKTIEVVYFQDDVQEDQALEAVAEAPVAEPGAGDTLTELHVCESCAAPLVYPTEWEEAGPSHWEVALRCPNCEWSGNGVFHQEVVERFDEELDRGTEAVMRDLKRLMHANMEEQIDRFVAALHADQILPMDF